MYLLFMGRGMRGLREVRVELYSPLKSLRRKGIDVSFIHG